MKELVRAFFVLLLLTGFASADWVPDDGHKMHYPQLPDTGGFAVNASQSLNSDSVILADDWRCSETGYVKEIHFWGAWKQDNIAPIGSFIIKIFSDIPADSLNNPFSRPGQELWSREISSFYTGSIAALNQSWFDPSRGLYTDDDHSAMFQYNIFLDEADWFIQERDSIYWLSIHAIAVGGVGDQWGWVSTLNNWNDDAVWTGGYSDWFHLYEPPGYPPYVPGDVDNDGDVDWDDVDYLDTWDYYAPDGGPPPMFAVWRNSLPFYPSADANGSCSVTPVDESYLTAYLNTGTPLPTYCSEYPPAGSGTSLDLAFVINGEPEDIPTLSEWGLLILALLLLAAGSVAVIRRRRVALRKTARQ